MSTKQLMVATGLMLLATACKEEETIKPSYGAPVVSSPAPKPNEVDSDSVYTTEGAGQPVKLRHTSDAPGPKSDVMPETPTEL